MECNWIKVSPSLQKGISVVNTLEDTKFEQLLKRIVITMKSNDKDAIFTEDERNKLKKIFKIDDDQLELVMKTIIYIFKRALKFIFMPSDLKQDFMIIGLNEEKADILIKVWSAETSTMLNELTNNTSSQYVENPDFSWKLNAELSSIYQKKCKVPKAYLKITGNKNQTEIELTHDELHSMFLKFESIQHELDNLLLT